MAKDFYITFPIRSSCIVEGDFFHLLALVSEAELRRALLLIDKRIETEKLKQENEELRAKLAELKKLPYTLG